MGRKKVERLGSNPFEADPVADVENENIEEQIPDSAEADAFIIGQPQANFNAREQSYISEQMKRYIQIINKSPGHQHFVHEILLCDIDLQRHDAAAAKKRALNKKGTINDDKFMKYMREMQNIREVLMKRYRNALEAIGLLPKDTEGDVEYEETLVDVQDRYILELNKYRKRNQEVGDITDDAKNLALKEGLDPTKYNDQGNIMDEFRKKVVAEYLERKQNGIVINSNDGR